MKNVTEKCMVTSFVANVFLTIIKITFGLISKSKTLIADGIHCLSDLFTDIIGIVGTKISNKKADTEHPFGHGKAEYIASLFISVFIIVLSVKIFTNSFTPIQEIDNYFILFISIISIIVKYFVSGYLIKKGKEVNSNILLTSGTESRFDVLSSAIAFVFILLSLFARDFSYLKYADTIGSIVISILTFRIGIKLFIKNFNSSLGEVELNKKYHDEIREILSYHEEILNIRRITILKYGSYSSVTVDLEMNGRLKLKKVYEIEQEIKKKMREIHPEYKYITINERPYNIKQD